MTGDIDPRALFAHITGLSMIPSDTPRTPPAPTAETPRGDSITDDLPALQALQPATPPREEPPSAVLRALELARHDLTALHGLVATDQPNAYGDALREGLDANAARECQQEVEFTIDNAATLAALDAVLPRTAGIVSLPTPGAGEGAEALIDKVASLIVNLVCDSRAEFHAMFVVEVGQPDVGDGTVGQIIQRRMRAWLAARLAPAPGTGT